MPIYNHNGRFCEPMNIGVFIDATKRGVLSGPLPWMRPVVEGYASKNVINLSPQQAALIPIGIKPQITRAKDLLTCACVIYVSTHPLAVAGAWVYHADCGVVSISHVKAALVALGDPPPASVRVIVATPNSYDKGYVKSIATIAGQGIPEADIVVIPNLLFCCFGIDNQGFMG